MSKDEQTEQKRKTAEQHAADLGTPAWAFAAAKAVRNWSQGAELTEEEYREAVQKAANEVVR